MLRKLVNLLIGRCHLLEKGAPRIEPAADDALPGESVLICATCGLAITDLSQRIEKQGASAHTFANPAGHVFHIGCFASAPGCAVDRRRSTDFSWFDNCAWSIAICRSCFTHLGWFFTGDGKPFFGLILKLLVEKDRTTD